MKQMNQTARRMVSAVGALALVAMLAARANAESIPQVVQVLRVEGNAKYSTDGKTWQNLRNGTTLQPGTIIMTAEKSLVDIAMGEKSVVGGFTATSGGSGGSGGGGGGSGAAEEQKANVVRIFESTVLSIDKLTVDRTGVDEVAETQLDLRAGQIMGNVKKLSAQSRYEIKIPNGVAGIRGTSYLVSSAGVIEVIDGSVIVVIIGADGTPIKREIPAGHMFDPAHPDQDPPPAIPPEQYKALQIILHELPVTVQAAAGIITSPATPIIYISPIDGSPTR